MSQAFFETSVENVRERHSLTASDRLATEETARDSTLLRSGYCQGHQVDFGNDENTGR